MKTLGRIMRAFRSLGPIDIRNVGRDGLMLMLLIIPLLVALAFRLGVPPLAQFLQVSLEFDLRPYYALLMSTLVMTAPNLTGVVVGFLLLDERDDGTLAALQVTPLSPLGYLGYRILIPLIIGFVMTLVSYPLAGLAPLAPGDLAAVAAVGMLTAPVTALALAALAGNKVTGLVVQKALNGIWILPAAAFFLPMPWQLGAGIIPSYWAMKTAWTATTGAPYLPHVLAGFAVNLVFLVWLARRFLRLSSG